MKEEKNHNISFNTRRKVVTLHVKSQKKVITKILTIFFLKKLVKRGGYNFPM